MKLSHEVLLALSYVSQISDPDKVRSRFIESLNGLDEAVAFEFAGLIPPGIHENRTMPIATLRSDFGCAVMTASREVGADERAVFRNAFQFLAVLIENRLQARILESKNESLLKGIEVEKSLVRSVLDTLPVGVLVVDEKGTILMANAEDEKIWGGSSHKGIDRYGEYKARCSDTGGYIDPGDWGISSSLKSGETVTGQEIDLEFFNGTIRTILHSSAPLLNEKQGIIGAIGVNQDITKRKQAEDALRESEKKFKHVFESANVGKSITSLEGEIESNNAFCELLGYSPKELRNKKWQEITPPEEIEDIKALLEPLLKGEKESLRFNKRYIHKNGSFIWADVSVAVSRDSEGNPNYFITTIVDITDRKKAEEEKEKLEAQLLQARKMESVGRLAGGVAHDYNNFLSVILGYTEMALEKTDKNNPLWDDLQEILTAARNSNKITNQLLAFARKQIVTPKVVDLNQAIEDMLNMLRRLIGEDIDLSWLPDMELWLVKMDSSQLNQILVNLCVNARDSIAGIGRITIETENVTLDPAYCSGKTDFVPGEYASLVVSDNGCGMDKKTLERLFEPFFTTKGIGQGTGLGLSTVYGIVRQNDGLINVYSEPGEGTTFRIYLPRHAGTVKKKAASPAGQASRGRGETILVVEDEASILKLATRILEGIGYKVLPAGNPEAALELAGENIGEISMLITDVVMPGMNGRELAESIHARFPDMKILFMSGYTSDAIAHRGVLEEGVNFLSKPFTTKDLAAKVKSVMDSRKKV